MRCFGWSRHEMDFHLKKIVKKGQFPSFLHDLNSTSVQRKFPWAVPWFHRDKRWSGGASYPAPAEPASFWHVAGSGALPGVATGRNVMFVSKIITISPTQGLASATTRSLFSVSLCCSVCGCGDAGRPSPLLVSRFHSRGS